MLRSRPDPRRTGATPPALLDYGLESPDFVPRELREFAARGYQRRNRWHALYPETADDVRAAGVGCSDCGGRNGHQPGVVMIRLLRPLLAALLAWLLLAAISTAGCALAPKSPALRRCWLWPAHGECPDGYVSVVTEDGRQRCWTLTRERCRSYEARP